MKNNLARDIEEKKYNIYYFNIFLKKEKTYIYLLEVKYDLSYKEIKIFKIKTTGSNFFR
jgi:hypothetical protein